MKLIVRPVALFFEGVDFEWESSGQPERCAFFNRKSGSFVESRISQDSVATKSDFEDWFGGHDGGFVEGSMECLGPRYTDCDCDERMFKFMD